MQHDNVLKKLTFDLLTLSLGSGAGLQANICYYVAAFVIPFNWICNMTSNLMLYLFNEDS